MRGATMLPVKNILKKNYRNKGAMVYSKAGVMTTSVPKKQEDGNLGDGSSADGKTEPIVAFNKPPLPPFLGPLLALSLLEMGSGGDKDS
ncbi:hypothetical protein AAC387_Pa01g3506 [Persea americana]